MRYEFRFGYWTDTQTGERQPPHTYDRALFGLGPDGGPYHTDNCPGCAWARDHEQAVLAEREVTLP
jgi:hypothetical protein